MMLTTTKWLLTVNIALYKRMKLHLGAWLKTSYLAHGKELTRLPACRTMTVAFVDLQKATHILMVNLPLAINRHFQFTNM